MLIAIHKPYGVLSQFTPDVPGQRTLAEFGLPPNVYAVGRLDLDSEGLLLLSDEKGLNSRLLDPRAAHWRRYWAQVEGTPEEAQLALLRAGVKIGDSQTLPAKVQMVEPDVPPRDPPIRERKSIPTAWIEIELREGKNRQVRRMTAAVGLPTLRLIRVRIGEFALPMDLLPGQWRELNAMERSQVWESGRAHQARPKP